MQLYWLTDGVNGHSSKMDSRGDHSKSIALDE